MTKKIKNYEYYGALTQYFRWYQVYECEFTPNTIANQLDILSDDIEITSQAGTIKGKKNYPDRLKLFKGWQNAHHVNNYEIKMIEENLINLQANITYQNIRPDTSRHSYNIFYDTILIPQKNNLPLFQSVKITATGIINEFNFQESYSENRVKSLIYYYLFLYHQGIQDKNTHNEIFCESLNNHQLTNFEPENIQIIPDKNSIIGNFNDKISNKIHEWRVINDKNQRFAQIKNISIL